MAFENYNSVFLNQMKTLLLGACLVSCHMVLAATVLQSYPSTIIANTSKVMSEENRTPPARSKLQISDPNPNTVWTVSETAKIKWSTINIDTSKSIRFFLAKDDMVVQELGSFKNNSFADGIALAKNVGSGDQYQVVGIELFPDDKYRIAKHVTPYFTIRNPVSDARKAAALAKRTGGTSNVKSNEIIASTNEFEGRKISYIEELSFVNENISVSLWDHGRQDGDIVSIYLNGKSIISKYLLTYQRKKVNFKLDPTKTNELFLYAHNLGSAPPNTVSIELTDGNTSEKIVLNSDLQSCEAVQIKVQ